MSDFLEVIQEAAKKRQEKEVRYKALRHERWKELKALAEESDLLLDGRRRKKKLQASA